MKKSIIGFLTIAMASTIGLALVHGNESSQHFLYESEISALDCTFGQCNAIAASTGNRCLHCVSNSGDSYCWQH
jgi:hypothetical protein